MRYRFWLKQAISVPVSIFIGSVVASAIFGLLNLGDHSLAAFIGMVTKYAELFFLGMSSFMAMAYTSQGIRRDCTLVISLGSTRREAQLGLFLCRAVILLVTPLMMTLICVLSGDWEHLGQLTLASFLLCLFSIGVGSIVSDLTQYKTDLRILNFLVFLLAMPTLIGSLLLTEFPDMMAAKLLTVWIPLLVGIPSQIAAPLLDKKVIGQLNVRF